ncbi:MAG: hypothetical protein QXI58_08710 [Candidatus Micrarchaeia archaeon]
MEESNRPKLWIKRNPKWSIISYDFWHMSYPIETKARIESFREFLEYTLQQVKEMESQRKLY